MMDERLRPGPSEGARRASGEGPGREMPRAGPGLRMSAKRKHAEVLRVLRGEDLELVSRDLGTPAARISRWRDEVLAAGLAALKTRPGDDREVEVQRLRAKVGELTVANELLEGKIEHLEAGRPLARRRSRR
jgi:transposase